MKFTNFNTVKNTAISLVAITAISVGTNNLFLSSKPAQADNSIPIKIAQNSVKSGKFVTVKQEKQTTGQVKIVTENGKRYLELSSDFSTAKGPDVQIILHRNSQIGVNPKQNEYFNVAMLKSFQGGQRYLIPDYVNINEFKSVGIWCREFNVTFAFATI
ncbi:DM13 domain-containing protein [Geminocystis sp. GBBB08]|uniref:DM13 domain-containing protein n=1 Tax=Geminocystis sp. GBBB08 TaxID=2604140 RepID=UPI0027E2491B|nr:DM13 domain-containing protein [Geminocystis sp. GBBB08]MBL1210100.1 DM13 domain-containing protein [Geminocystis sp. GBBB08]